MNEIDELYRKVKILPDSVKLELIEQDPAWILFFDKPSLGLQRAALKLDASLILKLKDPDPEMVIAYSDVITSDELGI